jgi:hypothetical protein
VLDADRRPVPIGPRIALSLALGVIAAFVAYQHAAMREPQRDFTQVWFAARAVLHGDNPYALVGPGLAYDWPCPLLYPLTAAIVAMPLAALPQELANTLFMLIGASAFAWSLMRFGYGPLIGFASASMLFAAEAVQWSPLLAAAAVVSPLGIILAAKPTIGAAIFAARPNRWAIGGAIVLTALALIADRSWIAHWLDAIGRNARTVPSAAPYQAPVTIPGGVLALACLVRWRRPEARLVAVLACIPQTLLPYEWLYLFLVPRGWHEALLLTATSWGALVWVLTHHSMNDFPRFITACGQAAVIALYIPATILVLRRPNEGSIPDWLEGRIGRLRRRAD